MGWQAENADWKKKYENEARLRVEEGDALKKKFTLEITSLTDNLHNLEQKLKAAENAKAKLTSEVGVLVKDFEHSQVVIKELTAKLGSSDKTCNDLAVKLKAEFEKSFGGARSEYEANKKKLVDEINVLSRKLAEAESRLKNEVEVIKKKMSITITELEMSLDASNKGNAQLQNTCKVQNEKIMQLTSTYEDVNRKLGASVQ